MSSSDPAILILRDPRESIKKCSLTPLRGKPGVVFQSYYRDRRIEAGGRVLLDPEGAPFTEADRGRGLFLIDCSWRRVGQLAETVDGVVERRRLPELETAYPRKSRIFEDPATGLASIEALFVATLLLGEPRLDLLDEYRWRDGFLETNAARLAELGFRL